MNAFENRNNVGLFLKKTISGLLQKWNNLKNIYNFNYKFGNPNLYQIRLFYTK